jgi:hypothetical protein
MAATEQRSGIFATKPVDRLVEETHTRRRASCAAPSARST